MSYAYSQENRILKPHKYMYTPYEGKAFLGAYFADRRAQPEVLQTIADLVKQIAAFIPDAAKHSLKFALPCETNLSLKQLLHQQLTTDEESAYKVLSGFIKKFEVTKKLCATYNTEFKGSGDHTNTELYLWLSLNCLVFYSRSDNLKMLNCALKLSDLLSSCKTQVADQKLLTLNFSLEMLLVQRLMQNSGVTL